MIETVHRRKDGRLYPVEISVNYVNIDGREYNFAFARDITARKKIGELLRLTQHAVDSAMDEAYWILPDGSFFYVNDRACESLGYSRQELLSLTLFDIAVGFEPPLWGRHWEVLQKAKHIAFEGEQRRKDGSTLSRRRDDQFCEHRRAGFLLRVHARCLAQEKSGNRAQGLGIALPYAFRHLSCRDRPCRQGWSDIALQ
jgi:PAS domain-containing protein